MSQVLALKYRPRRFEDLIGQGTISQTLSLALDSNRLSHAYLFSGLRGSGKTSTARIMSKALLCSNGPTSKPCDVCDNCKAANEYRHIDIIEMDAASNRGIDDIKELIEHTKYKPSSAQYKVFIIDEVHMLTPQAFNALLKTLEEPPAFVKFILATTDPLKLPATILSRTQHFRFKKISQKDVVHHLSHILNLENIDYEAEALEILSRSGQGSLRDTLTMLDQAIIFAKGKLTTSSVTDMLGLIDPQFMNSMFDLILNKGDINTILPRLEEYEAGLVIDEMTIYLKNKMLENDPRFDVLIYDRFFRILADAKQLLFLNSDSSFVLILTFSKMIEATNLKSIDEIINQVEDTKTVAEPVKQTAPTIQQETKIEPIAAAQTVQTLQEPVQTMPEVPQTIVEEPIQNIIEPTQTVVNEPVIEPTLQEIKPVQNNIASTMQAEPQTYVEPEPAEPTVDYQSYFAKVIKNIYERNYELANCFEQNFLFENFENDTLFIRSKAEGDCKKLLWKEFGHIRIFIEEVFGSNTHIEFIKDLPHQEELKTSNDIEHSQAVQEEPIPNEDDQSGSMLEDIELGSGGCVADMCAAPQEVQTASQKEEQVEDILESPMVNKIKELFDPKKIIIKSKV